LLSILGLLDAATTGTVIVSGYDVSELTERQKDDFRESRIGFVFQSSFLISDESALSNAELGLRVRGVGRAQRQTMASNALAVMGLSDKKDRRSGALSGGERQRVALARAMVKHPEILLTDEPTGALDSTSSHTLIDLLRKIASQGTTVVVVTHDPLVAAAADRVLEIVDGTITTSECAHSVKTDRVPVWPDIARKPHSGWRRLGFNLQTAFDCLFVRPIKSLTIALAYCLGIAALVLSVGLTQSATGQVAHSLIDASSNMLAVSTSTGDPEFYHTEGPRSAIGILTDLPGIHEAFPLHRFAWRDLPITRFGPHSLQENSSFDGTILVTTESYLHLRDITEVAVGSLELFTNSWNGSAAILGSAAATALGISEVGQGMSISVDAHLVPIVAILAPALHARDMDNAVLLSPGTLTEITASQVDRRVIVIPERGRAEPLAIALPAILHPASPGSIVVSTPSRLADLQAAVTDNLSALLGYIAVTILALSALTAATVMYLSVQHRTHEIALRRALGDSRLGIWRQFTAEGLLLGLFGGLSGSALGIGATVIIAQARSWEPAIGTAVIVQGIITGLAIGALASSLPAMYAAKQPPAAILRST